jgi:hypothetical protein
MATTRITGAVLIDVPAASGKPASKLTGAVLLDVPDTQIMALVAAIDALSTKLDAIATGNSARLDAIVTAVKDLNDNTLIS